MENQVSSPAAKTIETFRHENFRREYANHIELRWWVRNFAVEFGKVEVSNTHIRLEVFEHVHISPQQAKQFMICLQEVLGKYEQAFGPINLELKASASKNLAESIPTLPMQ